MSKIEKRLNRIRQNTNNVPITEFEALIKKYGDIEEGAKHPKALIGPYTMPYKRENPIKSCYVKELLLIIDSFLGEV